MNKKLIILFLTVTLCLPTFAQQEAEDFCRHEISIGYGFHPVSGDSFYFGEYASYDVDNIGAFYGAYTYFINKHVGVGGTYCFDPRMLTCSYYGTSNPLVADLDESCHSLMGHVKFNCIFKKHFTCYSKFDAGICFWDYKLTEYQPELFEVVLPQKHCCFAWNIAAGVEAGNDRIAGFAQVSLGMEGTFSLGIRYKFNNKSK